MNLLGNEFLAGAGFAADEDGAIGGGDLFDLLEDLFDGLAAANELPMGVADFDLGAQIIPFGLELLFQGFDFGVRPGQRLFGQLAFGDFEGGAH